MIAVIVEWLEVAASVLSILPPLRKSAAEYLLHVPVQSGTDFHESCCTHQLTPIFL